MNGITAGKQKLYQLLPPIILFLIVLVFWILVQRDTIKIIPEYNLAPYPYKVVSTMSWKDIWTWTDYGYYYRYAPIGFLVLTLIDRDFIAPSLGIPIDFASFISAGRLIPIFLVAFSVIAVLTFFFCKALSFSNAASFVAGLYIGVNDGFSYFFWYVDTLAICWLVIFSISLLLFWHFYIKHNNKKLLIGYYIFLLLLIGTWEQWVNLLAFLVLFSLLLAIKRKGDRNRILMHGILVPMVLFSIYFAFKLPQIRQETGNAGAEAQYVFSYPSKALMIEDMVTNASEHISSTIDALFFPWPMMSQSIIQNINMHENNLCNEKNWPRVSTLHYQALTEWYNGLLFGIFLIVTIILCFFAYNHRDEIYPISIGLLLTYTGFLVHLPVMNRVYFDLPGYVGLLNYKDMLTVLGVSILLGWITNKIIRHFKFSFTINWAIILLFSIWIINNNYHKIAINFLFPRGELPLSW